MDKSISVLEIISLNSRQSPNSKKIMQFEGLFIITFCLLIFLALLAMPTTVKNQQISPEVARMSKLMMALTNVVIYYLIDVWFILAYRKNKKNGFQMFSLVLSFIIKVILVIYLSAAISNYIFKIIFWKYPPNLILVLLYLISFILGLVPLFLEFINKNYLKSNITDHSHYIGNSSSEILPSIAQKIKIALNHLDNAEYSDYFDTMDDLEIPKNQIATYNRLKNKFINESFTLELIEKLRTFTRGLSK